MSSNRRNFSCFVVRQLPDYFAEQHRRDEDIAPYHYASGVRPLNFLHLRGLKSRPDPVYLRKVNGLLTPRRAIGRKNICGMMTTEILSGIITIPTNWKHYNLLIKDFRWLPVIRHSENRHCQGIVLCRPPTRQQKRRCRYVCKSQMAHIQLQ